MEEPLKITWYGRCCFLVEYTSQRILFDPYDRFCDVDIGTIEAEVLISSSTWHDHGHIGSSPGAWIFTYPGKYIHEGFDIYGIETKEERGSPTVVFNIQFDGFSITNFADMGVYDKNVFTKEQTEIILSTNIAFIRAGHEDVMAFCQPKIIIYEHYFPSEFVNTQIPQDLRVSYLRPIEAVENSIELSGYPVEEVVGYEYIAT
jgi:hypothetical protein